MNILIVPALYYAFTGGVYLFKDIIQKYNFDYIKNKYNYFMVAVSITNFMTTFYVHYNEDKFSTQYNLVCKPYESTNLLKYDANLFLYSKIFEWVDTFFLIAYNKKLSILHLFHHGSTFVLCYLNIYPTINSLFGVSILTNSFVHIFMYAYYNGHLKIFRKYITQIQILQHIIVLYNLYFVYRQYNSNILCGMRYSDLIITFGCYFSYLILFANFYIQNNYLKNKSI